MKFTAPAKIILLGEHAVVYGKPAIAVPILDLQAEAVVSPNPNHLTGLHINAIDLNEVLPVDIESTVVDNAMAVTARLVLKHIDAAPPDVTITIRSSIPIASGLGSGAAVSTALARSLSAAVGSPLSQESLNSVVYEVEKLYHGTPSGIDNSVIVFQKPVFFVRHQPIQTLSIGKQFMVVIADTGQAAPTKIAVSDVRRLVESNPGVWNPVLDEIGEIVIQARTAIESGDNILLGSLMLQNHRLLKQLTISSEQLDILVETAMREGALGAKLSGAGRGGNMIALTPTEKVQDVQQALLAAGAVRVFTSVVKESQD